MTVSKKTAIALAAALLCATTTARAEIIGTYDFNDNQVPDGWSFTSWSPRNGYGAIENQRFQVHNIDGGGYLTYDLNGESYDSLTMTYIGSMESIYWGNSNWLRVETDGGAFVSRSRMASYNYGSNRMRADIFEGDDRFGNLHTYADTIGAVPNDPGTYRWTHTLQDGSLNMLVQDLESGAVIHDVTAAIPLMDLSTATSLSLYQYINAESYHYTPIMGWIDDLVITGTPVGVPEPGSLALFATGLFGLTRLRRRNPGKA
ncbi:PEP-CTERM sorting domain-containing protein [Magnetospira sp. QH-2]|uniref:PEP-CTERM sorting domain-containing protein n=1 Tax=Magnetospira sp. (strain QH-2) TaxID=1288970 RepID=UPI0003E812E8|nr:PEP-CTERM sorting domain-containing protein [Magnetospira sp. QH-2]CCQ73017.1 exported protein of unknown function [Magnetospira sp. QH-2]